MELEREVRALRIVVRRVGVVVRIRTRRPRAVRPARPRGIAGGVVPPAGGPPPRDAGWPELVADRRAVLHHELVTERAPRLVGRLHRVHGPVAPGETSLRGRPRHGEGALTGGAT